MSITSKKETTISKTKSYIAIMMSMLILSLISVVLIDSQQAESIRVPPEGSNAGQWSQCPTNTVFDETSGVCVTLEEYNQIHPDGGYVVDPEPTCVDNGDGTTSCSN